MRTFRFMVFTLSFMLVLAGACKLRQKADETTQQYKERRKAVYSAQTTLGLDAWSDAVEKLGNGKALDKDARRIQYDVNERVLTGFDVVRERLRNPATGNGLDKLKSVLTDLREAQRREVIKIVNLDTRAQVDAIFEISLFALESLQAVLEAGEEPTRAELDAQAQRLARKAGAIPQVTLDLIALARDTGLTAWKISRLSTEDAWKKSEALSMGLHSKNAARLDALGAQVF